MWKARLQDNYEDFVEFQDYCENYNIAARLGFDSAEQAWADNPFISGSTNPHDLRVLANGQAYADIQHARKALREALKIRTCVLASNDGQLAEQDRRRCRQIALNAEALVRDALEALENYGQ